MEASQLVDKQKKYFKSGATRSIEFRIHQLKTLKKLLNEHLDELNKAVHDDLRRPEFEIYATEIGVIHHEINFALKHLHRWVKPKRVSDSILSFPSKSYSIAEPRGTVLIVSTWNYPIHLALLPLVGAIAAGNTAVIKPSEYAIRTSATLARVIKKWFKSAYIDVVEGDADVGQELLRQDFDYIFFTGSPRVGKLVMKAAAENLTPVTLELGGKSPCIVDESAELKLSAKRIAWGKFLNAGQTCIAPDYLLIHESIKNEFLGYLKNHLISFYGVNAKLSPDYPRIINQHHFVRLTSLIDKSRVFYGGKSDRNEKYIEPTILQDISPSDGIMQEEIFGPLLPVLTFNNISEAIHLINQLPHPMALYVFSRNKDHINEVHKNCSFGCGAVNDVVVQIANPNLAFGGVGQSGIGSYHGKHSFDTFSHRKSILRRSLWLDIPLRYAPYKGKLKWVKRFIK